MSGISGIAKPPCQNCANVEAGPRGHFLKEWIALCLALRSASMRGGTSTRSNEARTPHHGAMTPEKIVDVICRSFRTNESWTPSKALSKCLSVPYSRLLIVATPKDDISNLIWTSVLVLVYCATHLVDYHESWYEVSDASTVWLRRQQHFTDQREDLVSSACTLLNAGDPDQLLTTLFALETEVQDPAVAEEDAALLREGWQRCFLDEPPYTAYYWNAETNYSTWRHPLETAQMERELKEQKEKRQALLAKIIPMRLPINRDAIPPSEVQVCSECAARAFTVIEPNTVTSRVVYASLSVLVGQASPG
ncbi:unnamed protein product [Phytophthora lilii]|uniref:Unnamed protein product n=1 Tax=Phytophthora lilii TaxID=2077276 RepID=A0A9W6TMH0_9STRA|nr:unnamed protein product [Phytophthora lilii]